MVNEDAEGIGCAGGLETGQQKSCRVFCLVVDSRLKMSFSASQVQSNHLALYGRKQMSQL